MIAVELRSQLMIALPGDAEGHTAGVGRTFESVLKGLRAERGMTLQQVADAVRKLAPRMKTSHQTVSQWESGTIPMRHTVFALDEALDADGALIAAANITRDRVDEIEARLEVVEGLVREIRDVLPPPQAARRSRKSNSRSQPSGEPTEEV